MFMVFSCGRGEEEREDGRKVGGREGGDT